MRNNYDTFSLESLRKAVEQLIVTAYTHAKDDEPAPYNLYLSEYGHFDLVSNKNSCKDHKIAESGTKYLFVTDSDYACDFCLVDEFAEWNNPISLLYETSRLLIESSMYQKCCEFLSVEEGVKTYIFYTTEGFTQAPDDEQTEISNCQLLGRATGNTPKEACKALLAENEWILECGFDPCEIIAQEVIGEKFYNLAK